VVISTNDTQLAENDMVYRLGAPSRVADISWIKPGKVAWDWWNNWGLKGVDFKAGINNETYKYYIDFASENGLEYVALDEGWSPPKGGDIMDIIPEIDLKMLIGYARSKNVDLILWAVWDVLGDKLEEACKYYSSIGIKGFKIDFMDRDDQKLVDFLYRCADMCAKYKLIINYHGMYKPTGLQRTYPNIVNMEGVYGLEELKWSTPDMPEYDVTFPYIRMLAGSVDYTQGAMRNADKRNFRSIYYEPMSQGTRCHQIAAYMVFDSPLTMLCDSPSNYRKEQECTDFIASIPTVFDITKVLAGKVDEYIVTLRQKDDKYYMGALTDWNARELQIDFSFLPDGNYKAIIFQDGMNANKIASDYKKIETTVNNKTKLDINLAEGGGWACILHRL
jgi:alpha-glucosidase